MSPGTVPVLAIAFLHPVIAGAAVGAGLIPVIIHLLNRRRYRRVRWAAMPFLIAARQRSARRLWIEQWLLLIMRIAAVVLLGLALARPSVSPNAVWSGRSSRVHRIILLDNSGSMNARRSAGGTRFDAAKEVAARLVQYFPERDPVSIVTMALPAETVIAQPAYDRRFVRERLSAIQLTQRATDTVGALRLASEVLEASDLPQFNRSVYVISDFPNRDWIAESAGRLTPSIAMLRQVADRLGDSSIDLHLELVGEDVETNLTVSLLETDSHLVALGVPIGIRAEVANRGTRTARDIEFQLRRNGRIVRRERIEILEPNSSAPITVTTEFAVPGTHAIEARVSSGDTDGFQIDDARYLSIEARPAAPVLLVDGRLGSTLLDGQAGFLATALAPGSVRDGRTFSRRAQVIASAGVSPLTAKVIPPGAAASESLFDYDVVALCNVGRLSAERWQQLEAFVSVGGGLIIFSGDLISAENYNHFGYRDGHGLLPGRILGTDHVVRAGGDAIAFAPAELPHPIVAAFADHPNSGLFRARVDGFLRVEVDRRRAEIVLRYTNHQPALIASGYGKGRVIFCTTTANMRWTNLPAKGDYVSLMYNLVAHVMPIRGRHRNVTVGRMIREPLAPAQVALPIRVVSGGDKPRSPAIVPDGDALMAEFGPIEHAGTISMTIGTTSVTFAVNTDPAESRLGVAGAEELTRALDRPVDIQINPLEEMTASNDSRSTELSFVLLGAVVVLLLGETRMAAALGTPRS